MLRRCRLDALPGDGIYIACSGTIHLARERQHGFCAGVAFHQSGPVAGIPRRRRSVISQIAEHPIQVNVLVQAKRAQRLV